MASETESSVIIATYNRRELVQRALGCVFSQTRPPSEVIVVDDGSTDGTGDALRAAYGDRVRHVWKANGGVSSARNLGLRLATGRYIALLDSDDLWHPRKLQAQFEWMEARPQFGLVFCNAHTVSAATGEGFVVDQRLRHPKDGHILGSLLCYPTVAPSTMLLRRDVYQAVGGFDEHLRTAEDTDFILRVAMRFPIGLVHDTLASIVEQPDSLSLHECVNDNHVAVVRRFYDITSAQLSPQVRRLALFRAYFRTARSQVFQARWRGAVAHLGQAMRLAPDWQARRETAALLGLALKRTALNARQAFTAPAKGMQGRHAG